MQIVQAAQLLGIRPIKMGPYLYLKREDSVFSTPRSWIGVSGHDKYKQYLTWEEWCKKAHREEFYFAELQLAIESCG